MFVVKCRERDTTGKSEENGVVVMTGRVEVSLSLPVKYIQTLTLYPCVYCHPHIEPTKAWEQKSVRNVCDCTVKQYNESDTAPCHAILFALAYRHIPGILSCIDTVYQQFCVN
jgi:hypothetical protein